MTADHPPATKTRTGLFIVLALVLIGMSFAVGFGAGVLTFFVTKKPTPPYEQTGMVNIVAGQEGVVNFPIPYSSAPNVDLDTSSWSKTAITECTSTGFKWKNTGMDDHWNNGKVRWTARGVK
jgi:hypothetical protein